MIKVNSRVIILRLCKTIDFGTSDKPALEPEDIPMIVEGLYYLSKYGIRNINSIDKEKKPQWAKCLWYNTRNELQEELINLEILTEL